MITKPHNLNNSDLLEEVNFVIKVFINKTTVLVTMKGNQTLGDLKKVIISKANLSIDIKIDLFWRGRILTDDNQNINTRELSFLNCVKTTYSFDQHSTIHCIIQKIKRMIFHVHVHGKPNEVTVIYIAYNKTIQDLKQLLCEQVMPDQQLNVRLIYLGTEYSENNRQLKYIPAFEIKAKQQQIINIQAVITQPKPVQLLDQNPIQEPHNNRQDNEDSTFMIVTAIMLVTAIQRIHKNKIFFICSCVPITIGATIGIILDHQYYGYSFYYSIQHGQYHSLCSIIGITAYLSGFALWNIKRLRGTVLLSLLPILSYFFVSALKAHSCQFSNIWHSSGENLTTTAVFCVSLVVMITFCIKNIGPENNGEENRPGMQLN